MVIVEPPPRLPSPGSNVSASLPTEDSLLESHSSTNSSGKGLDPIASALVNPLSSGQSKFMQSAQGRECKYSLLSTGLQLTFQSTSEHHQTGPSPDASSVSLTNTFTKAPFLSITYSSMD
jgi:hypothetical protein